MIYLTVSNCWAWKGWNKFHSKGAYKNKADNSAIGAEHLMMNVIKLLETWFESLISFNYLYESITRSPGERFSDVFLNWYIRGWVILVFELMDFLNKVVPYVLGDRERNSDIKGFVIFLGYVNFDLWGHDLTSEVKYKFTVQFRNIIRGHIPNAKICVQSEVIKV